MPAVGVLSVAPTLTPLPGTIAWHHRLASASSILQMPLALVQTVRAFMEHA
tara:strand:- start:911 stop:1063 length:153 start_codon:yes stop_codon:yes gene_type:complete